MYRKHRELIPLMAVLLGGLVILASLSFVASGATVLWLHYRFVDSEGYISSDWVLLQSSSYAIVQGAIDHGVSVEIPRHVWSQRTPDTLSIKLTVKRVDAGNGYFFGIASESDVSGYLEGVAYDEILDTCWSSRQRNESTFEINYIPHDGGAPELPPLNQSFWVATLSGSGTQTLEYTPEHGEYWAVLMNTDNTSGVNVEVQLAAKIPGLVNLGNWLFAGGLFGILLGGLIIYIGAVRNRKHELDPYESLPPGDLVLASWGERLFAYLIDLAILLVLTSWMVWPRCEWIPHSIGSSIPRWMPYGDFGFRTLIFFLYWAILEGLYGQSVGKKMIGIKTTRLDGSPAGFSKAAIESIGKAFLAPIDLVVGLILYGDERLFSRLSGTIVVKVERRHLALVEAESQ